jgi:hypothetical protein
VLNNKKPQKSWLYAGLAAIASLAVLSATTLSDVTHSNNGGNVETQTNAPYCVRVESIDPNGNYVDGTSCSNVYSNNNGAKGKQLTFKELTELPAGTSVIVCSDQIRGWGFIATTPLKDVPPYAIGRLEACAR